MAAISEKEHVENIEHKPPGDTIQNRNPVHNHLWIPLPTQDLNDPLNWTRLEKYSTYLTVCFFTLLGTINATNLTVSIGPLAKEFKQSSTRTGYLVCFNTLWLGVGNIFWISLMRVVGKRPVYLLALLVYVAANVWSYEARVYGSLLAARMVSAFASSASDATVPSLVADLFSVHERGHCMMIFHLTLSCGFFLGPLISAYITQEAGWRWSCGFLAIAGGVAFLVGFVSIRETNYLRDKTVINISESAYPKKTFAGWLSVTNGYNKEASFFVVFWQIICLFAYPPIVWTGLTVGSFVGWNIVIQLTSSRTFIEEPYDWTIGDLGLFSIAGFIGAIFAFFIGGKLIDVIAARLTRHNNGRREPEFRLPAVIIPAVIGPMGVLTFGLCIVHKSPWIGAAFGHGMQGFGLTAVANILVTFTVDAYQPLAGEALVVVFVVRNIIGTILSLLTVNWQKASGVQNAFGEMVSIQYFFLLMAIPMFYYGKKIRTWTSKFGPMKQVSSEM